MNVQQPETLNQSHHQQINIENQTIDTTTTNTNNTTIDDSIAAAINNNGIDIELINNNKEKKNHHHINRRIMQQMYLPRIAAIPNQSRLLLKILIDSFVLILIITPIILLYKLGKPFKRGFYCDDDSIRYPYLESTISSNLLFFYSIMIPTVTICINEFLIYRRLMSGFDLSSRFFLKNYFWQLYLHIIPFIFTFLGSQLITDIAKYSIGRLRPHFLDVCRPKDDKGMVYDRFSTCSTPEVYVMDFVCTKNQNDFYRLKDSRLSFMSGHSSFAAVTLIYLVYYIQFRIRWQNLGLVKPLYQYLLICLMLYTGFSRISDYKHHWSDVLIGLLQGSLMATFGAFFISDLYRTRSLMIMYHNNNQHQQHKMHNDNGDGPIIIDQHSASSNERTSQIIANADGGGGGGGGEISTETILARDRESGL